MSEVQDSKARAGGKTRLVWAGAGVIAMAALLYAVVVLVIKPGGSGADVKSLAKGEMTKLVFVPTPSSLATIVAQDQAGKPLDLAGLKDQVVVVNLWATWCAPCVKEMPTLAKLQAEYAGKPVKVLAISLDKGDEDIAKARAFMADKPPLTFYHGAYALAFSITPAAEGLPTTLIYDRAGHEQARLSGGADWSTPDAKAVIDSLISRKG